MQTLNREITRLNAPVPALTPSLLVSKPFEPFEIQRRPSVTRQTHVSVEALTPFDRVLVCSTSGWRRRGGRFGVFLRLQRFRRPRYGSSSARLRGL